jgi:penicillin-binding protein 1A
VSPAKQINSKRPARKSPVRRKIYGEKHIYFFLIFTCILQTFFLGGLLLVQISLQIPDIRTVANYKPPQATLIYDRYGNIVDRMFTENRTVIPLNKMSANLPKAFVASEDGRFFEHPGLDFFSVLRAAIVNVRSGARSQGGSTITQQVAKSLLLTPEKTYIRKFKEAILAWRIDKLLTKEEILYIYLNQIYLGEGAYGVEAASQVYFGKSASRISLAECALLAGLPQAPSRYSLFDHLDRAVERQKYVLNRMAADGYVSAGAAKRAFGEDVKLNRKPQRVNDANGFFLQVVKKRVRAYLKGPLQSAGIRIYTNLDSKLQVNALRAVRNGVRASKKRQDGTGNKVKAALQGALVCMESVNGKVRALVGGTSFAASPFDRATQAKRPAGSTFKPFLYTAALNRGWSKDSSILDSPISIKGKNGSIWSPKNYSGKYHGRTSVENSLTYSLNSAAVRLMQKIGYKEVHKVARLAGIRAKLPPDLSLALGAADVSLLELTAAYTPFSTGGYFYPPRFINRIIFADGTIGFPEKSGKPVRIANKRVIGEMDSMLRRVVTHGTGKAVKSVAGVRGGKTGTSDDNRDAWFIGYDEKYTVGVWAGYDRNQSMGRYESGGATAAPVWRNFMKEGRR